MSTSISRGFKLKTTDLFQIQQYMMAWRDELRQVHRDSVARLLATKASDMIDEAATSPGVHGGRKPLSAANRDFRDRQREIVKSGYRDPEVDFEFKLELMPYDGCVYGIALTEREEWWKLFLSKDFVEDYSYWDASEGPDDVAEGEWEDRRVTWNAIFKSSIMSLISMTSLSVACTYELVHVEVDAVLERLPDFETRVRTQAKRLAMSDLLEKRAALVRPDEDRMSILFSAISKLNIWLRETSEGQAVFNDYEVKARETLAREISKDMLFTELPMSASTVEA